MALTASQSGLTAMVYVNAGKRGEPMPTPIQNKEQACKDAYNMGKLYALLAMRGL